jgi:hypothetical protein
MDQATTNGMDENEHQPQQPMEMLWSNILNNPAIQQFAANGGTGVEGMLENGELAQFVDNQQQQQTMMGDGGGGEENGAGGGTTDDQQLLDQAEALANCVAEKVVVSRRNGLGTFGSKLLRIFSVISDTSIRAQI